MYDCTSIRESILFCRVFFETAVAEAYRANTVELGYTRRDHNSVETNVLHEGTSGGGESGARGRGLEKDVGQ